MAEDRQFTAIGPPVDASGFPRSAFSTKGTAQGMVYGVNVAGDKAGLYAESVATATDRESHVARGVGVYGVGDAVGVYGRSPSGRGAAFESGRSASGALIGQIGLVPQPMRVPGVVPAAPERFDSTVLDSLPKEGSGGDLLATRDEDGRCTLWFCTREHEGDTPAVWSQVLLATTAAPQALEFADWTSVSSNVASGTLLGASVALQGTTIDPPPGSTLGGTFTSYNTPDFNPPLPASDAIHFRAGLGNSYTLSFGEEVTDPLLHLASLASTLHFPTDTQITQLSGDNQFHVSANRVVGAFEGEHGNDGNGTVRLSGRFSSIRFETTNTFGGLDGVLLQVGAARDE